MKIINSLKQLISNRQQTTNLANSKTENSSSTNLSSLKTKPPKSVIKKSLSNSYKYFNYLVRYQIGAIAPKAERPQTVIVVAKKKKSKSNLTANK